MFLESWFVVHSALEKNKALRKTDVSVPWFVVHSELEFFLSYSN
jgi:hypothetical protein